MSFFFFLLLFKFPNNVGNYQSQNISNIPARTMIFFPLLLKFFKFPNISNPKILSISNPKILATFQSGKRVGTEPVITASFTILRGLRTTFPSIIHRCFALLFKKRKHTSSYCQKKKKKKKILSGGWGEKKEGKKKSGMIQYLGLIHR